MRPWAHWTARTAVVAVGLAAASGGLSGVALAGTDGGNGSGTVSVLSGNGLLAPLSLPVDICGDAAALLGIANAGCQSGAASIVTLPAAGDSTGSGASGACQSGAVTRFMPRSPFPSMSAVTRSRCSAPRPLAVLAVQALPGRMPTARTPAVRAAAAAAPRRAVARRRGRGSRGTARGRWRACGPYLA